MMNLNKIMIKVTYYLKIIIFSFLILFMLYKYK